MNNEMPRFEDDKKGNSRSGRGDRRATGRLPQELFRCNLGTILDLSAGGMRVLCRSAPYPPIVIELASPDVRLRVQGEIAWIKRRGFFKCEVGIRFVNLDPSLSKLLTRLAIDYGKRRYIAPDQAA